MPAHSLHSVETLILRHRHGILQGLRDLIGTDLHFRRFQLDHKMLDVVCAMTAGCTRKHEIDNTPLLSNQLYRVIDDD